MATIIQYPFAARRKPQAAQQAARSNLDRGMRIPTRELKTHIAILELLLAQPRSMENAVQSRRIRKGMTARLEAYRMELAIRDARDNAPLDGKRLSHRVDELRTRLCHAA